jgi:predicted regulator of Ras-like GTPase activity (Roadblock/LC7/MglB family)
MRTKIHLRGEKIPDLSCLMKLQAAQDTGNFNSMVNSRRICAKLRRDFSMTKSRADQMVERLQNMQAAAPDIEASAIVSVDGLIMASALQQGVEEDRVSAMSAAMLSLGERISSELGRGGLEQVYIKGNAGSIILTSVGEEAVLTAMARQEAKLGLIFLEMRRASEDLVKLVG